MLRMSALKKGPRKDPRSDSQLMVDLCKGDEDAFAEVVKRFERPIYSHLIRMLGNEEDVLGARDPGSMSLDLDVAMSRTVTPEWDSLKEHLSSWDISEAGTALSRLPGAFMEGIHISSPSQALLAVVVTVLLLILLKNFAQFFQIFFVASVEEGMLRDLRVQVYRHLLRLDLKYFAGSRTGELTSRLTADVVRIKGTVTQSMVSALRQFFLLGVYFFLTLWVSWKLTLITLPVLCPVWRKPSPLLQDQP